jgi:predicted transcriptional regulator
MPVPEALSEDAKIMLALIRKNPGMKDYEISWNLRFDMEKYQKAVVQLRHKNLIDWKMEEIDDKFCEDGRTSYFRIFPRI